MSYVSDELRLIHIHVPKTGGTSIRTTLNSLYPSRMRMAHNTAAVTRRQVGEDLWLNYFSFGFVRNPWDLLVSFHRATYPQENFVEFVTQASIPFLPGPQLDYFTDEEGHLIVNHIGRFENIEAEFKFICKYGYKEISPAPTLFHMNMGNHPPYQECYTPALRDYVGEIFASDLLAFGYKFGD